MSESGSAIEFELVLPCYNEERSLTTLVERTVSAAQAAGFSPERFRLVLVENGSRDQSLAVMEQLAAHPEFGPWLRIVRVEVNQGYGNGLWRGLATTTAPYVAWSHADQQCDPQDAFTALAKLHAGTSGAGSLLIKGARRGRSHQEKVVSRVFELIARFVLGLKVYEINAQPKVFERRLLQGCPNPPKHFAFDLYVLYQARRLGYRIDTIAVDFPPRVHGFSNWAHSFAGRYKTILGMIRYMFDLARSEGRIS